MAIQAVALFGAIIAAIAGPFLIAYCERRRRSRVIGDFVVADYFGFRMSVEKLSFAIRNGGFNECTPMRPYGQMFDELLLAMPPSFDEALKMATDADPKLLRPCTDMIRAAMVYNGYVAQFSTQDQTPESWPPILKSLGSSLEDVRSKCSTAWGFFTKYPDPVPDVIANVEKEV
jgi:hypothetical protein